MFILKLNEQSINLKWGTWAMFRACKLAGNLTIDQFFTSLMGGVLEFDKVCIFLRAGVEAANNGVCEYTDMQFGEWVDECGGMFKADNQISDYFNYIVATTTNQITPLPGESKGAKKKPLK